MSARTSKKASEDTGIPSIGVMIGFAVFCLLGGVGMALAMIDSTPVDHCPAGYHGFNDVRDTGEYGGCIASTAQVPISAHVAKGAVVEDSATLGANATVGADAHVGKHAVIGNGAVIGAGVTVPDGAVVQGGASLNVKS